MPRILNVQPSIKYLQCRDFVRLAQTWKCQIVISKTVSTMMCIVHGHWPFLVSFCVPEYEDWWALLLVSLNKCQNVISFEFPNPWLSNVHWPFPGFTLCTSLCVWPKPRVQRQKESLRRYYSFNLTNVKPNDSSTGLLAQNYVWPQWPCWTYLLWFHSVCVVWAVPRYCSFLKCQP